MAQGYNVIVSYDDAKAYLDRGPRGNALDIALHRISTKAAAVDGWCELQLEIIVCYGEAKVSKSLMEVIDI